MTSLPLTVTKRRQLRLHPKTLNKHSLINNYTCEKSAVLAPVKATTETVMYQNKCINIKLICPAARLINIKI